MTRHIRESILWVGATLGMLCIGWTLVMFAFGLTPLVFTSGSMSPAIGAGDLGFAKSVDAADIEVGDVISVVNEKGTRITHRVVQVDPAEHGVTITMKGDANNDPDVEPYAVTDSAQRVAFSIPKAGYVVNAVSSPMGMFLGGLLAATALFVAFGRRDDDGTPPAASWREGESADPEPEPDNDVARRVGRALTVAAGASTLVVAAAMSAIQPTMAAWTDTATVATGTINTTMVSPSPITCTGGGFLASTITLNWTHVDARYDYRVVTRDTSNNVLATIDVAGSGAPGQSGVSATVSRSGGLGLFWYDRTATVMSKLKTSPTWLSTGTVYTYREGRIIAGSSIYCE